MTMPADFDFHNEKTKAVLKVRAQLLKEARNWFDKKGYTEVQGPIIIPAVGDWPVSFEVKYFGKKAYLTKGLQPYANFFAASLGKIYTIAPSFRMEKSRTPRHLTEYWRMEVFEHCDLDNIITTQEELIAHLCRCLSKDNEETLKCFNRSVSDLAEIQKPFHRLTYEEAIDILQGDGFDILWGQKIDWKLEKYLSHKFKKPFFIWKFPCSIETFFYETVPEKPELSLSADLLAPEGYGEIASGAQMTTEKEIMLEKMKEEKIDIKDQEWCLNFMEDSSVPNSGFATGIERLIQWVCKLSHIKEATAFPRLPDNIYP